MQNYLPSLLYALITALSVNLIEGSVKQAPPLLLMFATTTLAMMYFHFINLGSIRIMYRHVIVQKKQWLLICAINLGAWIATFYGIAWAGSFNFLFIYFVVAAMISFGLIYLDRCKRLPNTNIYLISIIGLLLSITLFLYQDRPQLTNTTYYLGIIAACIGGIFSYLYRKYTYIFAANCGLSATQVLAVRFYGIFILGLVFLPKYAGVLLNWHTDLSIVIIAICSFILPNYFNQLGIMRIGADMHSIISAITPTLAYIIYASLHSYYSHTLLMISVIGCLFLALPALMKKFL